MRTKRNFMGMLAVLLLILPLTLSACTSQPATTDPTDASGQISGNVTPAEVTVMSWNIWHENVFTGQNTNWDRLSKVVQIVDRYLPDVFMTQETTDWWIIYLMQNLPDQYTWAYTQSNGHSMVIPDLPGNNTHPDETSLAIFYNKEKLELLDNGMFWLSATPDIMSKYDEATCFRITTWAKFRDIASGREFICVNTHLSQASENQFKVLMRFVDENIDTPMILAGDFNKNRKSDLIKELNAYTPLKEASQASQNKWTESDSNIDWMFVSADSVDVLNFKAVMDIMNISDHYARFAKLNIC